MSQANYRVWVLSVFLGVLLFGGITNSIAGVSVSVNTPNVSVNIGAPPLVVIPSPPPMVVIPGSYVYMAPNVGAEILFYHDHWYRHHEGHWFSARSYNGPWVFVAPAKMPRAILQLPPGYRRLPPGHRPIAYENVKHNWKQWEKEKHWHHDKNWNRDWREDRGEGGRGYEADNRGHGKKH